MKKTEYRRTKKESADVALHDVMDPFTAGGSGGVVSFCVHGREERTSPGAYTPSRIIKALRTGLPIRELEDLQSNLDVPMEQLVPMLGISKATLHRRKA